MTRHFSFAGMQRSGNHAIINWWRSHFGGYTHRNNILTPSFNTNCSQAFIDGKQEDRVKIDSWENFNPADIQTNPKSEPLVVILRDPYNWWASWYQFNEPDHNVRDISRKQTIPMYLAYIDYARKLPNRLPHNNIVFNKWFQFSDYRRSLEDCWHMPESDKNLHSVGNIGDSTFDMRRFDGQAHKMKVLSRYKHVMNDPDYYEPLRRHPELADISRELFDFEPPGGIHV